MLDYFFLKTAGTFHLFSKPTRTAEKNPCPPFNAAERRSPMGMAWMGEDLNEFQDFGWAYFILTDLFSMNGHNESFNL